jgi:hypothetical protein
MDMNEMQGAWDSRDNTFPSDEQQAMARRFSRQMLRRRRFRTLWLAWTFLALTVVTALAVRVLLAGRADPAQEWGLFPMLAVPWGFAFYFLRLHLSPAIPTGSGELSITDSVRASLVSNRSEQKHMKLVLGLFAIMIPILAVSMMQLQAVGKMSPRDTTSMALVFGSALLLSGCGVAARYFWRIMPQGRRLEALLAEFNR